MIYLLALLIGVLTGLRTLTPITVVSWAARLGRLHLDNTWMAFLGYAWTPYLLTLLALGELVADKLPKTPSRKAPPGFVGRVLTGSISGAAIGAAANNWVVGLVLGAIGAVLGTLGGAALRSRMAKAFGRDFPAALLEDAVAILGSILLVTQI